jgi:hypothetical protein
MFTATESGAILRLLKATNAVLAHPQDTPLHPEIRTELEHGRTAVATCYADFVDGYKEKLDKAADAMKEAWDSFVPQTRNSYGPLFDKANVRPEKTEAEEQREQAMGTALVPRPSAVEGEFVDDEVHEGEVLSVNGVQVAGLLGAKSPEPADEGEDRGPHYELDDLGRKVAVAEPDQVDDVPQVPGPETPVEDELGKRRRSRQSKKPAGGVA